MFVLRHTDMPFPPIYQKIYFLSCCQNPIFFLRIFIASLERPLRSRIIYAHAFCPQAIFDKWTSAFCKGFISSVVAWCLSHRLYRITVLGDISSNFCFDDSFCLSFLILMSMPNLLLPPFLVVY